ncbi:MAG: hypothetical protein LBG88_00975 [Christensenellaceae bacterium]|nr:hypothetical protein [Christensenellaceae bacterium]
MNKKTSLTVLAVINLQFFVCGAFYLIVIMASEKLDIWVLATAIALFMASIILFVVGCWRASSYVCSECGKIVTPTFWNWARGVHCFGSRKLSCPNCKKRTWCKHIAFAKETQS